MHHFCSRIHWPLFQRKVLSKSHFSWQFTKLCTRCRYQMTVHSLLLWLDDRCCNIFRKFLDKIYFSLDTMSQFLNCPGESWTVDNPSRTAISLVLAAVTVLEICRISPFHIFGHLHCRNGWLIPFVDKCLVPGKIVWSLVSTSVAESGKATVWCLSICLDCVMTIFQK